MTENLLTCVCLQRTPAIAGGEAATETLPAAESSTAPTATAEEKKVEEAKKEAKKVGFVPSSTLSCMLKLRLAGQARSSSIR